MRIAMIAPLFEAVPPLQYGGTERVIYFIVEELVRLGHTVTLYATRGSKTSAKLVECWHGTFREQGMGNADTEGPYTAQLKLALTDVKNYDIVHIHHNTYPYHPMVLEAMRTVPIVWTDHNAIHNDDKPTIFKSLAKLNIGYTALSESHKSTVPDANWLATIHHGLPINLLNPTGDATLSYVAFLGRISPEKGVATAVRIAEAGGYQMKVAAKVDELNRAYYEDDVKPLFKRYNVDFIGEISEKQKAPFLSGAFALLFPICWPEPFGLVMIEALACGCPVIAFRKGSVPEIIENGVTGFVVDTEEEAVQALQQVKTLDRQRIRQRFEERFTSTMMTEKYVHVYERVIKEAKNQEEAKEFAKVNLFKEAIESGSFITVPEIKVSKRGQRAGFLRSFSQQHVLHRSAALPKRSAILTASLG